MSALFAFLETMMAERRTDPDLPSRTIKGYGWRKDAPDIRDRRLDVAAHRKLFGLRSLPKQTDNYSFTKQLSLFDQLPLGSCTANGTQRGYRIARLREGLPDFDGSRLAHYYWTRVIEHTTKEDAGASIRDAVAVLRKKGTAPEADWPYDIDKFARRPPHRAYVDAKQHMNIEYVSVPQDWDSIRSVLASGFPIVWGFTVYESTDRALNGNGLVPMPRVGEAVVGGHCELMEDYGVAASPGEYIDSANSWGQTGGIAALGKPGYNRFPKEFVLNPDISSDFWLIRREVAPAA